MAGWGDLKCLGIQYTNPSKNTFYVGEKLDLTLDLRLGSLSPDDLKVEMLFAEKDESGRIHLFTKAPLTLMSNENGVARYHFSLNAKNVGLWDCVIRIIPKHELLPHDLDFNLVKWI